MLYDLHYVHSFKVYVIKLTAKQYDFQFSVFTIDGMVIVDALIPKKHKACQLWCIKVTAHCPDNCEKWFSHNG